MSTIYTLVATNKGWITRQLLKWTAIGSAALCAKLAALGVTEDTNTAIAAGIVAFVSGLIELGLSFLARKYAVK